MQSGNVTGTDSNKNSNENYIATTTTTVRKSKKAGKWYENNYSHGRPENIDYLRSSLRAQLDDTA